jgi:hypothetical protein
MNIPSMTSFIMDLWGRNNSTRQNTPFLCPLKLKINQKKIKIFGKMCKLQTFHGRFDNLCKQAELPSAAPSPRPPFFVSDLNTLRRFGRPGCVFLFYPLVTEIFAFNRVRSGADHSLRAAVGTLSHDFISHRCNADCPEIY